MSKVDHNAKKPVFSATSEERLLMSDEVHKTLALALNKMHGISYSHRFWKILMAPYVDAILTNRKILAKNDLNIQPTTYVHMNMFNPSKEFISYDKIRLYVKMIPALGNYKKIKFQLKTAHNIAAGFHYPKAISSEVDVFMDAYYPILPNKKIDHEKRKISIEYPDNYTKTFISNIIKYIPKVYIEYFDYLMDKIPLYEPEKKIFHVSMLENLFLRFTIAKYTEYGAKLYYYQHGGFYGEYKYHNAHHYESSIADIFMTWGWKIKENDMPSKAYRIEKFSRNFNYKNKKLFDLLLVYPSIYSVNEKRFKQISSLFFQNINRDKFAKICARPRPKSTFNRRGDLNFISNDVNKIDSGFTRLGKLISQSKLVILLFHPSTTILECLYVDQPVVALLHNKDPSEIIKPYYDYLIEKGVLHNTMGSLLDHLNTTNIDTWWPALLKELTYQQFKHEFLRKV